MLLECVCAALGSPSWLRLLGILSRRRCGGIAADETACRALDGSGSVGTWAQVCEPSSLVRWRLPAHKTQICLSARLFCVVTCSRRMAPSAPSRPSGPAARSPVGAEVIGGDSTRGAAASSCGGLRARRESSPGAPFPSQRDQAQEQEHKQVPVQVPGWYVQYGETLYYTYSASRSPAGSPSRQAQQAAPAADFARAQTLFAHFFPATPTIPPPAIVSTLRQART